MINKAVIDGSTIDEQSLCSIVFNAVYPSLSVTSVLGDGSLTDLSKSRLWNMLSIDQLVIYSILLIIQYIVIDQLVIYSILLIIHGERVLLFHVFTFIPVAVTSFTRFRSIHVHMKNLKIFHRE